ncbi:unnamed protein product [Boreogadus saida]
MPMVWPHATIQIFTCFHRCWTHLKRDLCTPRDRDVLTRPLPMLGLRDRRPAWSPASPVDQCGQRERLARA